LVVVIAALAGLLLLFADEEARPQAAPKASHKTPRAATGAGTRSGSSSLEPVLLQPPTLERSSLDNDLDNDGNYDGVADPSMMISMVPLLVVLSGGRLLLSFYGLLKLSTAYCPALERPG
jgi:hypothetical protein